MFTKSTYQDMFDQSQKFYNSIPKTEKEIKDFLEKVKNVYTKEAKKTSEVVSTYQKAATGDASPNELSLANKKAQSLMVTARFAALMSIPGAIFMIPALSKLELELDAMDFIPDSVRQEFDL